MDRNRLSVVERCVVVLRKKARQKRDKAMRLQVIGYFDVGDFDVFQTAFPLRRDLKVSEQDLYRRAAAKRGYTKNREGRKLSFSVVEITDPSSLLGEQNQSQLRLKNLYVPVEVMFDYDEYQVEIERLRSHYPAAMDRVSLNRYRAEVLDLTASLCVTVQSPVCPRPSNDTGIKVGDIIRVRLRTDGFTNAIVTKVTDAGYEYRAWVPSEPFWFYPTALGLNRSMGLAALVSQFEYPIAGNESHFKMGLPIRSKFRLRGNDMPLKIGDYGYGVYQHGVDHHG